VTHGDAAIWSGLTEWFSVDGQGYAEKLASAGRGDVEHCQTTSLWILDTTLVLR
jgi:hypothetical protein